MALVIPTKPANITNSTTVSSGTGSVATGLSEQTLVPGTTPGAVANVAAGTKIAGLPKETFYVALFSFIGVVLISIVAFHIIKAHN